MVVNRLKREKLVKNKHKVLATGSTISGQSFLLIENTEHPFEVEILLETERIDFNIDDIQKDNEIKINYLNEDFATVEVL